MKKIFKYQIPFEHQYFDLALPKGSRILTLQLQDGIPYLSIPGKKTPSARVGMNCLS